jgi:hypothetical protein
LTTLVGKVLLGDVKTAGLLLLGSKDIALLQEHIPQLVKIIERLDTKLTGSPCATYEGGSGMIEVNVRYDLHRVYLGLIQVLWFFCFCG